jgi:hypothetical protein
LNIHASSLQGFNAVWDDDFGQLLGRDLSQDNRGFGVCLDWLPRLGGADNPLSLGWRVFLGDIGNRPLQGKSLSCLYKAIGILVCAAAPVVIGLFYLPVLSAA